MCDAIWLLLCAGLVFLMQPGFMCLESGLTRSKNNINVAIKNLADFGLSVALFWSFGYALMFGVSASGWMGYTGFFLSAESSPVQLTAFFLFQAMFCGTATTIVSGAVAERMTFRAYLMVTVIISGLIYPLFGHWVWNGVESGHFTGWLGRLGFVDFAGSTVVHSIGGWVSLAALLVIGPRSGRFPVNQNPRKIYGSNLPFSVLGAMLLWLGSLGFNGGSTLEINDEIPKIIVHTIIAGVMGMIAVGAIAWWWRKILEVELLINGSIAGLVAITASCNVVTTSGAVVVGVIGGVVMLLVTHQLERWHIDDAVGAVALHAGAGVWGTIAVALLGQPELLHTGLSKESQLAVQLLGILVAMGWAFGLTFVCLSVINQFFPLRVSLAAEEIGLNVSEHGAKTELYDLLNLLNYQAKTQDLSLRLPVDPFTEVGCIALRYNQVMDSLEGYAHQLKEFNTTLEQTVQERTAELAQANQDLQHSNQLKDDFLANTSHELRTPLNGIIGIAESLLDGATGTLSPETFNNLTMIVNSGRRLANLVNDILDFSKLKFNPIELQIKPIGLREIVEVVLTLSQPLLGKKELQLINEIPPHLPRANADENRLQQILYNLVGNAIKFTDAGTIKVSAEVVIRDQTQQLAITISDTGIGIPEDKLERIFESFEQGDGSTARLYGGTGLGLALTKKLVELHGGNIWVQSQVSQGSQFTFTLPLAPVQERSFEREKPDEKFMVKAQPSAITPYPKLTLDPYDQHPLPTNPFKILIVDDEPINRQVLINHLSLHNYAIAQAENGLEALATIEQGFKPDLILLDVMMPYMTGYEVCRKLREDFPASELPILMLTAKNQVEDIVAGLNVGANDYLTKPVSKNELIARLKTHLRLYKIHAAYTRFVPNQFLKFLSKESIIDIEIGDQVEQYMSVLFADIRNFTTLSESMSPEENFKFINGYLSWMEPAIIENHGFIDKYIGDGIMALFSGTADDAVKAGIAMQQYLTEYNQSRTRPERPPLQIGIGINTGTLILGAVGGKSRMDSTVISDAVNLASRLENLTKDYGVSLLISHNTFANLENPTDYHIRFIAQIKPKGKSNSVAVFEVFDSNEPEMKIAKLATKVMFEEGLFLYYQHAFQEAAQKFKQVLTLNPKDKVAQIYLKRTKISDRVGQTTIEIAG